MGKTVSDIDMATDATPSEMIEMFQKEDIGYKTLGIEFGSLVVVPPGICITSFREDIKAYGRKVDVSFTRDLEKDSARRDFTINALYADFEGNVIDPQGGIADLKRKQVRFIGNPDDRINEDYLRVLRFFRFSSIYGDPSKGCDPRGLAAIKQFQAENLWHLNGYRIRSEILRVLSVRPLFWCLKEWQKTSSWKWIFPDGCSKDHRKLEELEEEYQIEPNNITSLAVLKISEFNFRIIFTNAELANLETLSKFLEEKDQTLEKLAYWYGKNTAESIVLTRAALGIVEIEPDFRNRVEFAATRTFPVKAGDIMNKFKGKELGEKLKYLEGEWISSGFELSKAALLKLL